MDAIKYKGWSKKCVNPKVGSGSMDWHIVRALTIEKAHCRTSEGHKENFKKGRALEGAIAYFQKKSNKRRGCIP
jgi:hypothetical protein